VEERVSLTLLGIGVATARFSRGTRSSVRCAVSVQVSHDSERQQSSVRRRASMYARVVQRRHRGHYGVRDQPTVLGVHDSMVLPYHLSLLDHRQVYV